MNAENRIVTYHGVSTEYQENPYKGQNCTSTQADEAAYRKATVEIGI